MTAQPGLCRTWSETLKTGFLRTRLRYPPLSNCHSGVLGSCDFSCLSMFIIFIVQKSDCLSLSIDKDHLNPELYESRCEKTGYLHMRKTKTQISFAVTAKLISAFVFATRIVQSLYFLFPKFRASSHLVWLYSPVCVGPARKSRRLVFSQRGSYVYVFMCVRTRLVTIGPLGQITFLAYSFLKSFSQKIIFKPHQYIPTCTFILLGRTYHYLLYSLYRSAL